MKYKHQKTEALKDVLAEMQRQDAKWGADLTFSGHIHGGVIRLPVLGGLFSPGRRFLPQYYAGEYSVHDKKLIVSRGIGGPRILNRPSLVLVTLKNE